MSTHLLSIIIPYYNIDKILLKRCLDSVLNQNLNKELYEVVIIDDGSSVSIQNLIGSFSNRMNISYYYQENQGLGGARNTGMEKSVGEYLFFIDADDYIYPNTLALLIPPLKEGNADLINFKFKSCNKLEIEQAINENIFFSTIDNTEYLLKHNLFGSAWLYIFKKTIIKNTNLQFTPGIFHEDEEFTTKLYYFAHKVIESNVVVYAYYQRPDSIIRKKDKAHIEKRFNDFEGVIKRLYLFMNAPLNVSNTQKYDAFMKKLNLLVCDYITGMVRNFLPYNEIEQRLNGLREYDLYPLKRHQYSLKYKIFRFLANRKLGIHLLYFIDLFREKIK